jgi:uncharacterized protein (TIGR00255 family)
MTGSGSAHVDGEHGRIEVEARSVNHRFLKVSVRAFGPLPSIDARIEKAVKRHASRGHVSVHVRYVAPAAAALEARLDEEAFAAGARLLRALAENNKVKKPTVEDVLRLPGVVADARAVTAPKGLHAALDEAIEDALTNWAAARAREGQLLQEEFETLLAAIQTGANSLAARAAEIPSAVQRRLRVRLTELLEGTGVELDEGQLEREVAYIADRADVREELARLDAHLVHARELIAKGGAIGRQLDFLVQELHRETNTVGSKSGDLDLARTVMSLKTDVERLREQVQNLE